MAMQAFYLLLAALTGAFMAAQGSLNSALGKITGLVQATFIVHVIGCLTAGLLILLPISSSGSLARILQAPWYTLLGGVLGVGIIYGVAASIPHLGVAVATTAIIVGQMILAMIIDHFGWFGLEKVPLNWVRLCGLVLLTVGAKLMLDRGGP